MDLLRTSPSSTARPYAIVDKSMVLLRASTPNDSPSTKATTTSRMVEQQPDNHPHIQDLFSWAEKARRLGVGDAGLKIDRPFIPDQEVEACFEDIRKTRKLLAALYPDGNTQLDPETIRKMYPKVFLILLLTGNGRFISHFVRHASLSDQYLPFETRPHQFPSTPNDDFFASFCHRQWEFCAQIFHNGTDQDFDAKDLILPIISIEKLGGGGSATVHKIGMHPAYNKLGPNSTPRNVRNIVECQFF